MNRLFCHILSGRSGACLELKILMRRTAKAFGVHTPKNAGCSASELLKTYAQFTSEEATRALQNRDGLEALHQALYQMAYDLGRHLCRWLRPKDEKDCLAVIVLLYRNIGIQIEKEASGSFCVRKCYFGAFYTPEICAVISAIDQGIFAGVYQSIAAGVDQGIAAGVNQEDRKLVFRERITEGYEVCLADFR